MDVRGARVLIAGAAGHLGSVLAWRLSRRGAAVAVAGRGPGDLTRVARACAGAPSHALDAYDLGSCGRLVKWAADEHGGLDAVVVCVGVAAFEPADTLGDAVAEHLITVNTLAPLAFLRASLPLLAPGGMIAAITGVVAQAAPGGTADHAAPKAALAAWLSAVRREQTPSGVKVLEIRLPHVETGFASRADAGAAPPLPPGLPAATAVEAIVDAMSADARLVKPGRTGTLDITV
ncbi:SDR family NAD(P)-dependent oxidoreductase [Streptomyces sp. NPDC005574]|uniref:SDR family NAD(P)-dependent oxidoreductase n=1 Tax=Streptomyces sp. NPDC005574 TaxID=3156891 RepID=UPI0033BC1204